MYTGYSTKINMMKEIIFLFKFPSFVFFAQTSAREKINTSSIRKPIDKIAIPEQLSNLG